MPYDPLEQECLLTAFVTLLRSVTRDGGRKRAKGEKPPWWQDPSHEPAIYSHLNRWKHGEKVDADSGAHPLVHMAWRCLGIAWQETYGQVAPLPDKEGPTMSQMTPSKFKPNHDKDNCNWCEPSKSLDEFEYDLPKRPVVPRFEPPCYSCGRNILPGEDHTKCRGSA